MSNNPTDIVLGDELADDVGRFSEIESTTVDSLPSDACSGCKKLIARIEKLEGLYNELASRTPVLQATQLGTTACYWLVIGLHCFAALCMFGGVAAVLAYPFLLGAVGTLAACHVLPVRSVVMRWLRSMLSVSLVCLAMMVPVTLLGSSPGEYLPLLLVGLPFVLVPALLGSKLCVWLANWRVLPPGTEMRALPRFRIIDILALTILAAVYAMLFRFASFESYDIDFSDGGWFYVTVFPACCMMLGISSSICARGMLAHRQNVDVRWLIAACLATILPASTGITVFLVMSDSAGSDWSELLLTLLLYGGIGGLICLVSPFLTFLFMRMAGYRMLPVASAGMPAP